MTTIVPASFGFIGKKDPKDVSGHNDEKVIKCLRF